MKNKIIKYREENNITQSEMAEILGISNVTLHHYETGKRNVPYDVAEKIAKILKKEVEDIFSPEKFSLR